MATFLLGIYGGFFSGGYVTILTAVFVAAFKTSFREAIATTKLLNIYSSAVATAFFMWRGLVDYKLGPDPQRLNVCWSHLWRSLRHQGH